MSDPTPVRLQKYLADAGICSRRTAESLIAEGRIWVNTAPAVLGQKIDPAADRIKVDGKPVRLPPQPKVTLAVHKPRGLVCSNDDPHNPDTVFDLVPREFSRLRFFCAGRLDKDSEGLVILTTDGDLANRLMHPSNTVVKRYFVRLEEPFPRAKLKLLVKGVVADGEKLKVEYASLLNAGPSGSSRDLDVHLHHGKKREIRLLFLALGFPVKRLRRYQIGSLPLRGIPSRAGRILGPREIQALFATPAAVPGHDEAPEASVASARPTRRPRLSLHED